MRALSFDTTSSVVCVALLDDGTTVWEATLEPDEKERQSAGSTLMPTIDRGMREASWAKQSLDLLITNIGPGSSFTGIRVGLVTARTLAAALNLPVVGVSFLETCYYALKQSGQALPDPVGIALSGSADQFYFAAYRRSADDPAAAVIAPQCLAGAAIAEHLPTLAALFADQKVQSSLKDLPAKPLPIIKNVAVEQAKLAWDRLSLKRSDCESNQNLARPSLMQQFPWQAVTPLYLRNPSVTLKKQHANPNPPNDAD